MGKLFNDFNQKKKRRQAKAQTSATKDKTTHDKKSISERRVEKQQGKMIKAHDVIVIESSTMQQPNAQMIEFVEDPDVSISDEIRPMLP